MRKLLFALLATAFLTSVMLTGCRGPTVSKDEQTKIQAGLQDLLDKQVKIQDIPGMVMAVRLADGTVIWITSGHLDPAGKERWSSSSMSAIGSVTKTFTAVVVMQLVEEKKLSLDDTIEMWFPEQPNGDKITIRMLLSHTSGLPNYTTVFGNDIEKWTREWTPEELIAEANKSGQFGKPGSRDAHYSNTNYIILGLIIEKITGHRWAQEVESRIIQPLDLKNTSFVDKENIWGGVMVPGYTKTPDGYLSTLNYPWYPNASTAWAAGGIASSVSDLMTFASALFDGKLVSRDTLAIMVQPVGRIGQQGWALGGATTQYAARPGFAMRGDIPGYHAYFMGTLDSKFIVTALVNAEEGDVTTPSIAALQYISQ